MKNFSKLFLILCIIPILQNCVGIEYAYIESPDNQNIRTRTGIDRDFINRNNLKVEISPKPYNTEQNKYGFKRTRDHKASGLYYKDPDPKSGILIMIFSFFTTLISTDEADTWLVVNNEKMIKIRTKANLFAFGVPLVGPMSTLMMGLPGNYDIDDYDAEKALIKYYPTMDLAQRSSLYKDKHEFFAAEIGSRWKSEPEKVFKDLNEVDDSKIWSSYFTFLINKSKKGDSNAQRVLEKYLPPVVEKYSNGLQILDANLTKNVVALDILKKGKEIDTIRNSIEEININYNNKILLEQKLLAAHSAQFEKSKKTNFSDWKRAFPFYSRSYQNKPFNFIQGQTQNTVNAYLSLKDQSFPEKVQQPELPPQLKLEQGQFESKKVFEKRVQTEIEKRNREIQRLQADYRRKVEIRNQRIAELQKLAAERKTGIESESILFAKDALYEAMKGFTLSDPKYDRDTGVLSYEIKATGANYSDRIGFESHDPVITEKLFRNPDALDWEVNFWVEKDSIALKGAKLTYSGKSFDAQPVIVTGKKSTAPLRVVIDSSKLDGGKLASLDALQQQNPNLVDRYRISAITYNDGKQVNVTFNDDIPDLLKNTKSNKADSKKWLVAIGVEQYEHTDPINFSKRSSELFIEAAQKKLGISERNTYAFIDGKATTGNIKDRLTLFLNNVKKGDTIYFYYSGHGIPAASEDNEPYILPADKIPDFISADPYFKLRNVYKLLSDSNADKVVAFIDSCFSGSTDGVSVIKGVAASRLAPKKVTFDRQKMVTLTAGKDKQYSNQYSDKGHRLFTYFLIKSLLSGKTEVRDIFKEVSYKVSEVSNSFGDLKKQEPVIEGNLDLSL